MEVAYHIGHETLCYPEIKNYNWWLSSQLDKLAIYILTHCNNHREFKIPMVTTLCLVLCSVKQKNMRDSCHWGLSWIDLLKCNYSLVSLKFGWPYKPCVGIVLTNISVGATLNYKTPPQLIFITCQTLGFPCENHIIDYVSQRKLTCWEWLIYFVSYIIPRHLTWY